MITAETGDTLDVEEGFKLLGLKYTSDMKCHANTKFICCKGYVRLWMLRNLKKLGAGLGYMMDVYEKQRSKYLVLKRVKVFLTIYYTKIISKKEHPLQIVRWPGIKYLQMYLLLIHTE